METHALVRRKVTKWPLRPRALQLPNLCQVRLLAFVSGRGVYPNQGSSQEFLVYCQEKGSIDSMSYWVRCGAVIYKRQLLPLENNGTSDPSESWPIHC